MKLKYRSLKKSSRSFVFFEQIANLALAESADTGFRFNQFGAVRAWNTALILSLFETGANPKISVDNRQRRRNRQSEFQQKTEQSYQHHSVSLSAIPI
ncbi:MAG: hypothetical protein ABI977_13470 [Acidobacteriota bacterium]